MTELQIIKAMGFLRVFMQIGMWVAAIAAADLAVRAYHRIRRALRSRNAF